MKLNRPLCFFDLETTGVDVVKDRIVEIGIVKKMVNGETLRKRLLINPGMPIPKESTEIHGITNEMVKQAPLFEEKAKEILQFIGDSDLAGFNSNKFDIPILAEEFERARAAGKSLDFDMKKRFAVDVQNIFHKMEPRTLVAALKFYCNEVLEDAHSALADTEATLRVFEAQTIRYQDEFESLAKEQGTKVDIAFLSALSNRGNALDFAGFIREGQDGSAQFSFGKHKGKSVSKVLKEDPGYYAWIQNADFPLYTKKVLTELKLKELKS